MSEDLEKEIVEVYELIQRCPRVYNFTDVSESPVPSPVTS